MTEVTEITETVIADLKTETEEDWLNFNLSEVVKIMHKADHMDMSRLRF